MSSSVKLGNWFEEDALEAATGCRYYPDPKDKVKASLSTNARTIIHSERMEPREYKSTQQMQIIDPSKHPDHIKAGSKAGPRQKMLEERMKKQIEEESQAEQTRQHADSRKIDYVSLAKDSFKASSSDFKPTLILEDPSIRGLNSISIFSYRFSLLKLLSLYSPNLQC